jgi:hypothetical protein
MTSASLAGAGVGLDFLAAGMGREGTNAYARGYGNDLVWFFEQFHNGLSGRRIGVAIAMDNSVMLDGDQRANRRVWWSVAALFALTLGAGVGVYLFYDIPDPEPATYAYDCKASPTGENLFLVFERDTETIRNAMRDDWTTLLSENDQLYRFEPGCEEALRAHVEKHREFVVQFQRLVREAERPLAYPGVNAEITLLTPMKALNVIQDGASSWQRAIQLDALSGNILRASEQALELTEFAKELSECDSTLLHWLVMMTVQSMGLKGLEKALQHGDLSEEVSSEYRRRLQAAELTHTDFAKCVRMEMFVQARTWERLRVTQGRAQRDSILLGVGVSSHSFEAMTFKPNMTIVENVQLVAPIIQGLGESWAGGIAAAQEAERLAAVMKDRGRWRNWLHPNISGRTSLATTLSSFDHIIQKTLQAVISNRCLQCALALRDYEAEEGRLPDSMSLLVPKHLPAVPEDPFAGAELKWNSSTKRIYTIGEDGRDDGGDFDPTRHMRTQKDWGIVYPSP